MALPPFMSKPLTITRELLANQALEIANMARERGELDTALEALSLIATLYKMYDDE